MAAGMATATSQTTAEAAVIGEITITQHTQQDKSMLDVLMLHNSSQLFCPSCCQVVN